MRVTRFVTMALLLTLAGCGGPQIARERSLAELEHIEACAVADARLRGGQIHAASRREQLEFLELLLRGEQVALGALDDELHGLVVEINADRGGTRA